MPIPSHSIINTVYASVDISEMELSFIVQVFYFLNRDGNIIVLIFIFFDYQPNDVALLKASTAAGNEAWALDEIAERMTSRAELCLAALTELGFLERQRKKKCTLQFVRIKLNS